MSISNYAELKLLETLKGTAFSVAAVYVKLHTGDPGEAGTGNAAANTSRQTVTFAAASAGQMANNAAVLWSSVPETETYSHVSLWDDPTAGNCLWSGPLTAAKTVNQGDSFGILSGQLVLALD